MNALLRWLKTPAKPSLGVRSVSRTHTGRIRTINEDRVLDRPDLGLWAVADGMGGHRAGDVAATVLIDDLTQWGECADGETLGAAIARAHDGLRTSIGGEGGTTLVALSSGDAGAEIHWAGDSRAYLIRSGGLRQLTRDHSVVQRLLDAGLIDEAGAKAHPQASVITSALGMAAEPVIDTLTPTIRSGDRVLLCSDGLSRSLGDRDATGDLPLDALADRLMTSALQRDGSDNISLVLIEFD